MTKVLIIANRFNLGGPTCVVACLAQNLPAEFETRLVGGPCAADEADSFYVMDGMGVDYEVLGDMRRAPGLLADWRALRRLVRLMREYRPDIVHTHASKSGALGRAAAWWTRTPAIVHTFHGNVMKCYYGGIKLFLIKNIERFLACISDAVVVLGEQQRRELCDELRVVPRRKAAVIPLGFDLSRFGRDMQAKRAAFRARHGVADDECLVALVGRMVPIKNHRMLVRVASQLESDPRAAKIRYLVVGDGETRLAVQRAAIRAGLAISTPEEPRAGARMIFTSWIREVDTVYAGSDVAALTSLNEGSPVSLIEAMAAGVPVCSTAVGGVPDIVGDGRHGLLSASDDDQAFARNLLRLAGDPALRAALGAQGREHAQESFGLQRMIDATAELYRKITRPRRRLWRRPPGNGHAVND